LLCVSSACAQAKQFTIVNTTNRDVVVATMYGFEEDRGDFNFVSIARGYRSNGWARVPRGQTITLNHYVDNIHVHMHFEDDPQRTIVPAQHLGKFQLPVHPQKAFDIEQLWFRDNKPLRDWQWKLYNIPPWPSGSFADLARHGVVLVDAYFMPSQQRFTIR
jgi:hypothetical protein